MPFNGVTTGRIIHADMSGYAYQLARDCINRDLRDYLWFCTDDGYFLLFADNLGDSGDGVYHPDNQSAYNFVHVQDLEADPPVDYWSVSYYPETSILVDNRDHCLIYGSCEYLPSLRTGVEKYAFFLCALGVGACVWVLVDRIFRRLY